MDTIPRIRALSPEISEKIAAGEVVERPLSIVKELMENAIDAGATSIVAEIQNGGKTYIRLTDNGCGIDPEDAELVFHRYATSKIASQEDLLAIRTLGFRGEALASIAAVSKVELITKTRDRKTGTKVLAEGGKIQKIMETGAEEGTTLIVTDLFYNTPARKKFLKPDHTESALITDYLSKMTLAYPWLRIRLVNNGTILFSTQGKGDVYQNILTVYSKQTANGLLAIQSDPEEAQYRLSGYVSRPDQSRSNRKHQIYFVNGRWIRSKVIDEALREAFADKLFEGKHPAAFLFASVPFDQLDVNIHPNKTEIRFLDEAAIRAFLVDRLRKTLLTEQAAPNVAVSRSLRPPIEAVAAREDSKTGIQVDIKYVSLTNENQRYDRILSDHMDPAGEASSDISFPEPSNVRFHFSELEIAGNAFAGYILAQGTDSLYLIDQHAAHERVLYEQLLHAQKSQTVDRQTMIVPWIVEIPIYLNEAAPGRISLLRELGYEIREFGPKEYIVKEIPAFMEAGQAEAFVDHMLHIEPEARLSEPSREKERLISRACKAAVKATERLDAREARELLRSLDKTENPFTCPHGRPTFLRLSRSDIEKMFLRK